MRFSPRTIAFSLLLLSALSACGQKGPLYLPGEESSEATANESANASSPTPEAERQEP